MRIEVAGDFTEAVDPLLVDEDPVGDEGLADMVAGRFRRDETLDFAGGRFHFAHSALRRISPPLMISGISLR